MTDAFLELAELYVIAPLPLWSPFHEAAGNVTQPESDPSLDQTDVVEVVAAGEGLTRFRFTVESDPKVIASPSSDSQHLAVNFIRGIDKITLAVVQNAGRLDLYVSELRWTSTNTPGGTGGI